MNSKQRRKAYRKLPQPGTVVIWTTKHGQEKKGIVVGPSPAYMREEPGGKPSVHRVRIQLFGSIAHFNIQHWRLRVAQQTPQQTGAFS